MIIKFVYYLYRPFFPNFNYFIIKPSQSVTRAEFAAFLGRAIQFKRAVVIENKDSDMFKPI